MKLHKIKKFVKEFKLKRHLIKAKLEFDEIPGDTSQPQFRLMKCPFCGGINHKGNFKPNKFYIGQYDKRFICYVCNESGGIIKLLAAIDKISVSDAFKKYLNEEQFRTLPNKLVSKLWDLEKERLKELEESKLDKEIPEKELPIEFEALRPKHKAALEYLKNRGILDIRDLKLPRYKHRSDINRIYQAQNLISDLDLRFCKYYELPRPPKKVDGLFLEQHVKIYNRIIIPIYFKGKLVGWQGRDISGKSSIPYYISPDFEKSQIIYNYDNVFEAEEITIVEGIFDLIKCWSHNPIMLFGKTLSEVQKRLLLDMPNLKTIIVALDPDTKIPLKNKKVSEAPYYKLVDELKAFWEVKEIDMPEGQDCGDQTFLEMKEKLDNAKPYKKQLLLRRLK